MADYDIYVLGEDQISISGGGQLDGVNQGSGVHLQDLEITLNSGNWQSVAVTDNDLNFQDSDGSQTLNGPATIAGVSYASGTVVEAEYQFTVTDGTNSWTLIGFNVNNSNPVYGTVEGIAVIGGPGGFPPVGVPLTVTSTGEGPSYAAADYATPICFASGTRIATATGQRLIEDIQPGEQVVTRSNGLQRVVWVGRKQMRAQGACAPVEIAADTFGNPRKLLLSQQHRLLVTGWRAELLYGEKEVLVPALHLVDDRRVRIREGGLVTYHHLLFEQHEIVMSEGIWSESLHLGPHAMKSLSPAARREIRQIFPDLETCLSTLPTLRGYEYPLLEAT